MERMEVCQHATMVGQRKTRIVDYVRNGWKNVIFDNETPSHTSVRFLRVAHYLFQQPMVYEKRFRDFNAFESTDTLQRFLGKIQYIKTDHGYIRSKSKINGVRDITFNLLDLPRHVQKTLSVGDFVSFRVNFFASGKFCAVDVQKDLSHETVNRSSSPLSSVSSIDLLTEAVPYSGSTRSEKSTFAEVVKRCEGEIREYIPKQPIQCPQWELTNINSTKSKVVERKDELSQAVDQYMRKVISRQFNSHFASCWLSYWFPSFWCFLTLWYSRELLVCLTQKGWK